MADNKRVQRSIKQLQRVKTWQLVILLILSTFLAATFLRLNNIGMIERRDAVLSADEAGESNEIIQNRLYDLQRYSAAHMNADTGSFYLEKLYARDSQKLKDQAQAQADADGGNIYKKVDEEICGPLAKANNWRWPDSRYISCLDTELSKYPAASEAATSVRLVSPDAYRHSFAAPLWSPDFAGFSVLICLVIVVMIIARLVSLTILRLLLRRHYKSI